MRAARRHGTHCGEGKTRRGRLSVGRSTYPVVALGSAIRPDALTLGPRQVMRPPAGSRRHFGSRCLSGVDPAELPARCAGTVRACVVRMARSHTDPETVRGDGDMNSQ